MPSSSDEEDVSSQAPSTADLFDPDQQKQQFLNALSSSKPSVFVFGLDTSLLEMKQPARSALVDCAEQLEERGHLCAMAAFRRQQPTDSQATTIDDALNSIRPGSRVFNDEHLMQIQDVKPRESMYGKQKLLNKIMAAAIKANPNIKEFNLVFIDDEGWQLRSAHKKPPHFDKVKINLVTVNTKFTSDYVDTLKREINAAVPKLISPERALPFNPNIDYLAPPPAADTTSACPPPLARAASASSLATTTPHASTLHRAATTSDLRTHRKTCN